jgi:hypothetical protein
MDVNGSKLQKAFAVSSNARQSDNAGTRARALPKNFAPHLGRCAVDWQQTTEKNNVAETNESEICGPTS